MSRPLHPPARRLLLKALYGLTYATHPVLRHDLRYFIRDNWYCKLAQFRFAGRDFLSQKPYKIISYQGEFDQELRYVLPFAYWHHLNGTLAQTISARDTKELYFFSPNHDERFDKRIWTESYTHYDVPNMTHSDSYSFQKWTPVPYRTQFANDVFQFSKPTLVIANKYNREWEQSPINFLSINILDQIIRACRDRFQIVYNRPLPRHISQDNSETLDLHEHDWLRQHHPDVLLMDDLFRQHHPQTVNNFNHLQLMVYANCQHFVSMHGGTAALASCFGGQNIILSNPGWGFEHPFREYETLFPRLSGAQIHHAKTPEEVPGLVMGTF
jgi:hypothetical protein